MPEELQLKVSADVSQATEALDSISQKLDTIINKLERIERLNIATGISISGEALIDTLNRVNKVADRKA
jgi:hypothetical protein